MRKTSFIRGTLVAFFFGLSSLCVAQNALIVQDGTGGIEGDVLANVTTKLTGLGNAVTANVGVPGGSLAGYTQIWDIRFNNPTPLSPSDMAAYTTYLQGGGALFLDGENTGFATRNNSIIAFVLQLGGGTISAVNNAGPQTVNQRFTSPNPVTTVTFLAAALSTSPGTGAFITLDGTDSGAALGFAPGTLAGAPAGALVIVYDVNFLQAGADANSQALSGNIAAYLQAPGPINSSFFIPTLSTWGLIALGLLLAAIAVRFLANRAS